MQFTPVIDDEYLQRLAGLSHATNNLTCKYGTGKKKYTFYVSDDYYLFYYAST